jgi:hypothetical protein
MVDGGCSGERTRGMNFLLDLRAMTCQVRRCRWCRWLKEAFAGSRWWVVKAATEILRFWGRWVVRGVNRGVVLSRLAKVSRR